jgi:hypothetical protein
MTYRRPAMRRLALIAIGLSVLAFTTLGFLSNAALAAHVTISGTHSTGDIKSHCDAAGGSYYNSGGVYGCFGPGGDVTCSDKTKKCFGTCGNCGAARSVGGILKPPTANPGGSKVGSTGGATTPTTPPPKGTGGLTPVQPGGAQQPSGSNRPSGGSNR